MVPFKTKLKPVLMNKKTRFKTSLSYFIALSYILHSAADLKKSEKTRFFRILKTLQNSFYVFLSNQIQVKG
jgi:meiotically up-regulated gene 157 (Mug157) protein